MSCLPKVFHPNPPGPLAVGSYVFCGWADPRPEWLQVPGIQCPAEHPMAEILRNAPNRVPLIGAYDERVPAVTERRLAWMAAGRLSYAVYQVDWRHDTHQLLMNHCAENHPADTAVKYCLSFFDVLRNTRDVTYYNTMLEPELDLSYGLFATEVARHTDKASYLRLNGRPVLFLGEAHKVTPHMVGLIRRVIPDVYLVATNVEPSAFLSLKGVGFDAFTEYLLYSVDGWAGVVAAYRDRWATAVSICKQTGIEYWVPACVGFDGAGQRIQYPPFMPTPEQFTAHLKEAFAFAQANYSITRGQVVIYAWSEFGEGGILEPMMPGMLHSGDEMIRASALAQV